MYMNNSIVLRYIFDNIEFRYVKSFDPQIADMGSGALKKPASAAALIIEVPSIIEEGMQLIKKEAAIFFLFKKKSTSLAK